MFLIQNITVCAVFFVQINAVLVSIRKVFQKHTKIVQTLKCIYEMFFSLYGAVPVSTSRT